MKDMELKFNAHGLMPCIVQDAYTGQVLMLAYVNEESLKLCEQTGYMHYYSRSRKQLWKKGETSGHVQKIVSIEVDCDRDTLLAQVAQTGPACHTGNQSCFYTNLMQKESQPATAEILNELFAVIEDRKENPQPGSYTNYLFDKGIDKTLKKVGEEATEVVIAAKNPDVKELQYEAADLLYHLLVLLKQRELRPAAIFEELKSRR